MIMYLVHERAGLEEEWKKSPNSMTAPRWAKHLFFLDTAKPDANEAALVCCVCLDELRTSRLPCCGRSHSTTAICASCVSIICASGGRCPVCRAPGLSYDPLTSRISLRKGEDDQPTWLWKLLWAICQSTSLALGDLVLLLMRPLDIALEQAMESAFSRGPV